MVCSQNVRNLCSLNAAEAVVKFCWSLTHLAVFTEKWDGVSQGLGLGLPSTVAEAQLFKQSLVQLKEDLILAKKALSLPLLEPLTKERLRQLTKLSMGSLLAAMSTATAHSILSAANPVPTKTAGNSSSNVHPKSAAASSNSAATNRDDEWESCAVVIVESAVEIYKTLLDFVQRSPRTERRYHENFLYLAAWLLLSGLQAQLTYTSQVSCLENFVEILVFFLLTLEIIC